MQTTTKENEKAEIRARMPSSEEEQHILKQRTEQISRETSEKIKDEDSNTYVCFQLGEKELYGIPYHYVKEVMSDVTPTKLPCASDFIAGVINRRGALLVILDLKRFFNFTNTEYANKPNILVIKGENFTIGVLADRTVGSATYDLATLEPPLSFVSAIKSEYIVGLHNGVTAILNVEAILNELAVMMS